MHKEAGEQRPTQETADEIHNNSCAKSLEDSTACGPLGRPHTLLTGSRCVMCSIFEQATSGSGWLKSHTSTSPMKSTPIELRPRGSQQTKIGTSRNEGWLRGMERTAHDAALQKQMPKRRAANGQRV